VGVFAPLLLAWLIVLMSPGPDFLAVLRTAASRSRRAGLLVACGVVTGIGCWAVGAMAGLTALLARYDHLYVVLRMVGAAFLIVYGLTTLRSAWRRDPVRARPAVVEEPVAPVSAWRSWRLGLLTNLANPKALVFFSALFASLLPPDTGLAARAGVVATMVGTALAWYTVVSVLASVPAAVNGYRRARKVIDTVTGGVFLAVGGILARP
jgi:threonine efflux protein